MIADLRLQILDYRFRIALSGRSIMCSFMLTLEMGSGASFEGRATSWERSGESSGKTLNASVEAARKISLADRRWSGRPSCVDPRSSGEPCRVSRGFLGSLSGRSFGPYSGTIIKSPCLSSRCRRISPDRIGRLEGSSATSPKSGERPCSASVDFLKVLGLRSIGPHPSTTVENWDLSSRLASGNPRGAYGRF